MSEILLKGEAADEAGHAEEQGKEPGALALSADDFSALEERVLRAVELVKRERHARAEAEERATKAESQMGEHGAELERLDRDIRQMRAERDHVRERVEKLLKQLDSIEL